MQQGANGNELALLVAAINKLLVDIGGGGETGPNRYVHCIIHDGLYNFQCFLRNCGAEKSFLKRCARTGEDMRTAVKTKTP